MTIHEELMLSRMHLLKAYAIEKEVNGTTSHATQMLAYLDLLDEIIKPRPLSHEDQIKERMITTCKEFLRDSKDEFSGRVKAIKHYRNQTGCSLPDAAAFVDKLKGI